MSDLVVFALIGGHGSTSIASLIRARPPAAPLNGLDSAQFESGLHRSQVNAEPGGKQHRTFVAEGNSNPPGIFRCRKEKYMPNARPKIQRSAHLARARRANGVMAGPEELMKFAIAAFLVVLFVTACDILQDDEPDSCPYTNDGECDEPDICAIGTDSADCSSNGPPPPPPPPTEKVLDVPMVAQQTEVWCWAAVTEMIFRYYNVGTTQCNILSEWTGVDCCSYSNLCLHPAPVEVIQRTLAAYGIRSQVINRGLSLSEVKYEIDQGRPIVVFYIGSSFVGHFVLAYGYDSSGNIYIHDPIYGTFSVPYGLTFSYQGRLGWGATIYNIGL